MYKLDGIKEFIEDNKKSIENMNKEMIARCSQVPLVWLTVEEAKDILWDLKLLKSFVQQICPGEESEVKERIAQFESRIKQAEAQNEIK